jgi:hypothetical protein
MANFQYDVFLSHNSQDKPAVKWLARKLEDKAGLRVFLDIWNLVPGAPWQEGLENALKASRTVAVFLGPAGISGWHNEELRRALASRVDDPERRVIPVLLPGTAKPEDDEGPSFLGRLTWVDFREGLDDEEAFQSLVAGIRGEAPGRTGAQGEYQAPKPARKETEKEKKMSRKDIDTGGGAYIDGSVHTGGGDFVGRDKNVSAGDRGVAIGGDVRGSNIVTGDGNVVDSTVTLKDEYVQQIYEEIEKEPDLKPVEVEDLKENVKEIQQEDDKGDEAEESFIARRLRNIQRIAPDILDVVLTTISNPAAGFGMVAKKVAERMKAATGES